MVNESSARVELRQSIAVGQRYPDRTPRVDLQGMRTYPHFRVGQQRVISHDPAHGHVLVGNAIPLPRTTRHTRVQSEEGVGVHVYGVNVPARVHDHVVLHRRSLAQLILVDDGPAYVRRWRWGKLRVLPTFGERWNRSFRVVSGVDEIGHTRAELRIKPCAHARHECEHLAPFRGIAYQPRGCVALLMTERALAHELLPFAFIGELGEQQGVPVICR